MKFLAIILALFLVVHQVDASEKEGDINIVIEQHIELPGPPDVDECFEDIDTCAYNEVCVNNRLSYTCICADGFEKVEGICEDVDECSKDVAVCDDFRECVNNVGSFSCKCIEGFEDVEGVCEDIDECIANENLCDDDRKCVNIPGNFTCNCNEGLEEVNDICKDINECNADNICGDNEVCTNSIGSYTCKCLSEYFDIGNGCETCNMAYNADHEHTFEWSTPYYPDTYPEDIECHFNITISGSFDSSNGDTMAYILTWTVIEPGMIHDSSNNNDCTMSSDRLTVFDDVLQVKEFCGQVPTGISWKIYGEEASVPKQAYLVFQSNSDDEASAKGIKFAIEVTTYSVYG